MLLALPPYPPYIDADSKQVFAPRPRSTIERGLSQPQDYLACSCCTSADGEEVGIRGTQPPTSIIYQLYLESGALINIYDLWSAFYSVIAGDEEDFDVPTAQYSPHFYFLPSLGL